jgi:hypothetical protein
MVRIRFIDAPPFNHTYNVLEPKIFVYQNNFHLRGAHWVHQYQHASAQSVGTFAVKTFVFIHAWRFSSHRLCSLGRRYVAGSPYRVFKGIGQFVDTDEEKIN